MLAIESIENRMRAIEDRNNPSLMQFQNRDKSIIEEIARSNRMVLENRFTQNPLAPSLLFLKSVRMREIERDKALPGEGFGGLMYRLYWEEKKSLVEVGVELGSHNSTIHKWLRYLGIERRRINSEVSDPKRSASLAKLFKNNPGRGEELSRIGREVQAKAVEDRLTAKLGGDPKEILSSLVDKRLPKAVIAERFGLTYNQVKWAIEKNPQSDTRRPQGLTKTALAQISEITALRSMLGGVISRVLTPEEVAMLDVVYPKVGGMVTYREIAEGRGVSKQAVHQVATRARKKLRNYCKDFTESHSKH